MKVILQKDIPNLGEAGDIKEVANGYARNFLLPKNLVVMANDSSKKAIEHQNKMIRIKKEKRKKQSEKLLEAISGIELSFAVQVGEEDKLFGSVTTIDIAKQLKEKGFEIDKKKIHLASPIKELGAFDVPIKLDEGITATVKVTVNKE
ncbi:MAG TPA: 50S ribosomal protein L9 [Spirochaetota bacterium]|nr:50S ribosomal protein L9 [Spirochaetota bacterium]HPJ38503.1 50S ribosomal protein L9 [Spirochaetota bacterium]HPQ54007.1 50S ribosomal protein L9 [Spirochaetota bacterium]